MILRVVKGFCHILKTNSRSIIQTKRCFSVSNPAKERHFQGEGKTTMNILNRDQEYGLMIDGFSQVGFRLNNNITILGSMIIFPRSVLSWTVGDVDEITNESLSLFTILEPKIDIIVIGIGDKCDNIRNHHKIFQFMQKYKLSFEILPTEQACATYNFLRSEGRFVAGAMIPPAIIDAQDDDLYKTKLRYQNLYETEWGEK